MVDTNEAKRVQSTNHERQALASSQGWGFSADAPELLDRWPLKPFTEIGDKRMAFGVVSGMVGGVSFTAFDYQHGRAPLAEGEGEREADDASADDDDVPSLHVSNCRGVETRRTPRPLRFKVYRKARRESPRRRRRKGAAPSQVTGLARLNKMTA